MNCRPAEQDGLKAHGALVSLAGNNQGTIDETRTVMRSGCPATRFGKQQTLCLHQMDHWIEDKAERNGLMRCLKDSIRAHCISPRRSKRRAQLYRALPSVVIPRRQKKGRIRASRPAGISLTSSEKSARPYRHHSRLRRSGAIGPTARRRAVRGEMDGRDGMRSMATARHRVLVCPSPLPITPRLDRLHLRVSFRALCHVRWIYGILSM